jgi:hypothetical protein
MIRHEDVLENSPSSVLMTIDDLNTGTNMNPPCFSSMVSMSTMMSPIQNHDLVMNNHSIPMVQTKIEGYQIALDEKNNQYAAFVIQILIVFPTNAPPPPSLDTPVIVSLARSSSNLTSIGFSSSSTTTSTSTTTTSATSTIVHRRFSEFAALHRKLRSIFPHDQLPLLPHTRLWNKLDPKYLKEKAVALNGYLGQVCKRCMTTSPRGKIVVLEFLDIISSSTSTTASSSSSTTTSTLPVQSDGRTTRTSSIASVESDSFY